MARKRPKTITVRLTEEEHQDITRRAADRGQSVGEMIRGLVKEEMTAEEMMREFASTVLETLRELDREVKAMRNERRQDDPQ